MTSQFHDMIKKAYAAFNARDIDAVLSVLHPKVHWANGWEGGYVNGHDEVKAYWNRQWKEVDPKVEPVSIKDKQDGQVEVDVHQIVRDLKGNIVFDGFVRHFYTIENGLIKKMEIEKDP
jgi:hypothetical protein